MGTYGFACRRDLNWLIKFWQDSLLHFTFSQTGSRIWFALRDLSQDGLLLCHSRMHTPPCMTRAVPEALKNMDNSQAGNKQTTSIQVKHHLWWYDLGGGFQIMGLHLSHNFDYSYMIVRNNSGSTRIYRLKAKYYLCASVSSKLNWFRIAKCEGNPITAMLLFPREFVEQNTPY